MHIKFGGLILGLGLLALSAVPVLADVNATFILTNGERVSGPVIYGREDNNIVDGRFNLGPRQFEMPDVAVIDFEGSAPSSAEAGSVPGDSSAMVMRDGSVVRGHLHNIIKGDYVQWVNEGGQRNNYPISSVRRLYLNPESARNTYLRSVASQPSTASAVNVPGRSVRVEGNQAWTDTGMDLRRGDRVRITANGQVQWAPGSNASPAGTGKVSNGAYPVPMLGAGGLIGKVGNSAAFALGNSVREFTSPGDGRLYLGINDDNASDNTGFFTVAIQRR
jgi:hypothetical protein